MRGKDAARSRESEALARKARAVVTVGVAMVLTVGQWVSHSGAAEWGVGQITEVRSDGMVVLRFGRQIKKLRADTAARVLVEAPPPAGRVAPVRTTAVRPREPRSVGASVRCRHCQRPLNESQRSADNHWKSCQRCSQANGEMHVFFRYPDEFGTSAARAKAGEAPAECKPCRAKQPPRSGRPCSITI